MSEVAIFDPSTNPQSAAFVRAAYAKRMREHADIVVKHIREILLAQEYLNDPEQLYFAKWSFPLKVQLHCNSERVPTSGIIPNTVW